MNSSAARHGIRDLAVPALLVCAGIAALFGARETLMFDATPGEDRVAPALWPSASRTARPAGRPILLLFAHPLCSCTKATLSELANVLERPSSPGAIHPVVRVLFSGAARLNQARGLWDQAAALPNSTVSWDDDGHEAKIFGAGTSGLTLLYSAAGNLQFEGGVTGSRGHAGSNLGEERLQLALETGGSGGRAFVFGCSLFGSRP